MTNTSLQCSAGAGTANHHSHTTTNAPDSEFVRLLIERIGRHRFDMWFGRSEIHCNDGAVDVSAESPFVAKWIRSSFEQDLSSVGELALGRPVTINVRTCDRTVDNGDISSFRRRAADGATRESPAELHGRRDSSADPRASAGRPGYRAQRKPSRPRETARPQQWRQLETFVVGRSNELAYAAACRLCEERESITGSPLFVHGPCGVGKTHLLQGVCQRMFAAQTGARVRYVTAEQFTNEYIDAVQRNTLNAFRQRARNLDLLAIDDVHFLSNKTRTQSEFLHTLDAIDLNGSRIMLASDNHPRHMKQLSAALISRMVSGLVVEIEMPDEAMRAELIRRLATKQRLRLSDAAVTSLAQRCHGSVRELEGAMTKVAALTAMQRCRANGNGTHRRDQSAEQNVVTVGQIVIEQLFADPALTAGPIHIERIIDVVCQRLSLTLNDLAGTGRHKRVVMARGLIAYLGRDMTTLSYPEIARALGKKNHSTIHTASRRIQKQLDQHAVVPLDAGRDPISMRELLDQLRSEVRRRQT